MIDLDAWLLELAKLAPSADGLTPGEMADKSGRNPIWISKQIKLGLKHGVLERAGKKFVERTDGTMTPVMAYRPVKKAKAK